MRVAEERNNVALELPAWAQGAFTQMFREVDDFHPDIIILTARKMPRIFEALGIKLASKPLIISDLAIPFVTTFLSDSRIAIIDDIVNHGSTLTHIHNSVSAYKPAVIKMFSLARRSSTPLLSISYASPSCLSDDEYTAYVRTVPAVISYLCKPYDLAFPIINAQYRAPLRSATDLVAWLRGHFGEKQVHVIPSPYPNSPVRRVSILFSLTPSSQRKIRLFFDDAWAPRFCTVVPMVIGDNNQGEEFTASGNEWSILSSRGKLNENPEFFLDGQTALNMFLNSLRWFWDIFPSFAPVLDPVALFSKNDAALVFGPSLPEPLLTGIEAIKETSGMRKLTPFVSTVSPFLLKIQSQKILESAAHRLPEGISGAGIDVYGYVLALIEVISEYVGTQDPREYKLDWPFSRREIEKNPYLRLRVGPTFADLLALCSKLHALVCSSPLPDDLENSLSITLDALIDQGSVVPTFANYGAKLFRIYRKGESPAQELLEKISYAVAAHGKPVSPTRLSKLLTVLSHSEKYSKVLTSSARTRGYVAGAPKTVIGAEPENIAGCLRNIGMLRPVQQ